MLSKSLPLLELQKLSSLLIRLTRIVVSISPFSFPLCTDNLLKQKASKGVSSHCKPGIQAVTWDVIVVFQSSAKYRWISSTRKYQQKMQVLSPVEEKMEFELWNLMFCALSTKQPQRTVMKTQNRVLGMQPLQQASSQLKLLHNFKMAKTIIPANNLFT